MGLDSAPNVRAVYIAALRHDLQKVLAKPQDWDRYNEILAEGAARRDQEQAAFTRDKARRIEEAKQMILREEHALRLDQPLPPGVMRQSDPQQLTRKAHARVGADHARRLEAIGKDEATKYRDLSDLIKARDAPTQVRTAFQTQAQTRSGPSRS